MTRRKCHVFFITWYQFLNFEIGMHKVKNHDALYAALYAKKKSFITIHQIIYTCAIDHVTHCSLPEIH